MGFTASCPASLKALWLCSTEHVGAVQPPWTTCRSQSTIARENKDPCLPQKAEPVPAVHQELLGQFLEQVDRQRPHCGTVLYPVPATPTGLCEPWVKADTWQGEGTRGRDMGKGPREGTWGRDMGKGIRGLVVSSLCHSIC